MSSSEEVEYGEELFTQVQLLWGEGFLSPGGKQEVAKIIEGVDLTDKEVLDFGAGIGGPACLLAEAHGALHVTGIDVQEAALEKAAVLARNHGLENRITLRRVEPGPLPFADGSFDAVFSKDAILHVRGKAPLFREVHRVLRRGGWVLASDWHSGREPFSHELEQMLEGLGQGLTFISIEEQVDLLAEAGFADITTVDRNAWYLETASRDLERLRGSDRHYIVKTLGGPGADDLIGMTELFAQGVRQGRLRLAHIRGRKVR